MNYFINNIEQPTLINDSSSKNMLIIDPNPIPKSMDIKIFVV